MASTVSGQTGQHKKGQDMKNHILKNNPIFHLSFFVCFSPSSSWKRNLNFFFKIFTWVSPKLSYWLKGPVKISSLEILGTILISSGRKQSIIQCSWLNSDLTKETERGEPHLLRFWSRFDLGSLFGILGCKNDCSFLIIIIFFLKIWFWMGIEGGNSSSQSKRWGIRSLMRRKQVDSDRANSGRGSDHQLAKELSVLQLIAIGMHTKLYT